jgi:hypothetical protein
MNNLKYWYEEYGGAVAAKKTGKTPRQITYLAKKNGFQKPKRFLRSEIYTKESLEPFVKTSDSFKEVSERLGLYCTGGSVITRISKLVKEYEVDTSHFMTQTERAKNTRKWISHPDDMVFVKESTVARGNVKRRIYQRKLLPIKCAMCGQDEMWHGKKMSLILDHINGVNNDHRLENLRLLCPNCNSTLPTHCGKHKGKPKKPCKTEGCSNLHKNANFCSKACQGKTLKGKEILERRKVFRPPLDQLLKEVEELGWSGTGRKYGVSDNAIRKWVKTPPH